MSYHDDIVDLSDQLTEIVAGVEYDPDAGTLVYSGPREFRLPAPEVPSWYEQASSDIAAFTGPITPGKVAGVAAGVAVVAAGVALFRRSFVIFPRR